MSKMQIGVLFDRKLFDLPTFEHKPGSIAHLFVCQKSNQQFMFSDNIPKLVAEDFEKATTFAEYYWNHFIGISFQHNFVSPRRLAGRYTLGDGNNAAKATLDHLVLNDSELCYQDNKERQGNHQARLDTYCVKVRAKSVEAGERIYNSIRSGNINPFENWDAPLSEPT